jgi:RimJ/RimL family protein N-acetyltransferase
MTDRRHVHSLVGQSCSLHSLTFDSFIALCEQGIYNEFKTLSQWPTEPMRSIIKKDFKTYKDFPELMIWSAWIICAPDGVVVGDIGFKGPPDYSGTVEIGYQVLPVYQNQGFATESVAMLCNFAFSKGVEKIEAEVLKTNKASLRVIENCGFVFVREIGEYHYFEKVELK